MAQILYNDGSSNLQYYNINGTEYMMDSSKNMIHSPSLSTDPFEGKVKSGKYDFHTKQFLDGLDASQRSFKQFVTWFEDICDYIQELEEQIKELNKRLVDDTPEHVTLIDKFIQQQVSAGVRKYQKDIEFLKNDTIQQYTEVSIRLKNTGDSIFSDITALRKNAEDNNDLVKKAMYYNSLPPKILVEHSSEEEDLKKYFILDITEGWRQVDKNKIDSIVTFYHQLTYDPSTDILTYAKTKIPEYDALFFNCI